MRCRWLVSESFIKVNATKNGHGVTSPAAQLASHLTFRVLLTGGGLCRGEGFKHLGVFFQRTGRMEWVMD